MTRLRVVPARGESGFRLYVSLPDGRHVAWYDHEDTGADGRAAGGAGTRSGGDSGRICLVHERLRQEVLAALAPYITGGVTVGPPPVPTAADLARLALHPDDDLAPNRPGEALHGALDRGPGAGRAPGPRVRRAALARLAAEEAVGGALDLLDGAGWRILHSVPLPGADRVDHLAVGPGGVLAVHTLAARGRRVRIAGLAVRTGRAGPEPLLRRTLRRAERASHALATGVRPVLAVVGASRLEVLGAPEELRIVTPPDLGALARLGPVHKPADVETLFALARDRRTWLRT